MSKFINIIINPVGDLCNLKCRYCYTLERKEEKRKLEIESIFKLVDYISMDKELKCVNFTWHGGEPLLMGTKYMEEILRYQACKLNNVTYYNIIQSNGILIDEEWIELIKEYGINLGISIDGPDYASNSSRFSCQEEFEQLLHNLELLKAKECLPALFCTLTPNNVNKLDEIFRFIEKYRPYAYMFNPLMDCKYAISADEFSEILMKMREFSERTGIINTLTYHIDNGLKGGVPQLCLVNGMCHKFISMDNNGNIYASCISHESKWLLTNIKNEDAWIIVSNYVDNHIDLKRDSIYMRLNQQEQYRYFQGNGCVKCRTEGNNEEFVNGIIKYMETFNYA